MKYRIATAVAVIAAITSSASAATTITYEDAVLGAQGYLNNVPYTSAGVTHSNSYNSAWGSWSGFAISNHTDTTTAVYTNQYSAISGSGAGDSSQYAVGYLSASLIFQAATNMAGMGASFNNTTYTALSMRNGDGFAKKFGGASGTDEDWFKLTITGMNGDTETNAIDFFLADFRGDTDTIVSNWTAVDFSALGTVDQIVFTMSSTDNGDWGMNTPAYFAMDNLMVPEASTFGLAVLGGLCFLRRSRRGL